MRSEQKEVKNLLDKLDNENKNLKTKLDEIIEKSSCENRKTRAPSSSEVSELLQHCTSEVAKRRLNQNFEEKLSKIPWEIIKVGKRDKKNIMDELRWERRITKMISNIGTILFGTDLLTHLLGRNGKRERSRRESERPHVFNVQQESRLRRVLSVFDDTFTSDKTWKHVVQYHINQKGRDVKKAKKRLSDEYTSDSATDSEPIVKKAKKTDITEISSSDSDSSNQKDRGKRNPPRKSKLKETEIIERNDEENAKEKFKEKDKPDEIGNRKKHDNMETGIGSSKSDDVTSQLVCEKPANNNNDKELTEISDKTKDNFPYSQAIPLTQNL
ncbi:uncharacterized protein LOC128393077 [Panonychus citri]|uniref:uncharacterized protein LOC128393077 n=1 Tax=Panonychus citri TaxID=50023 RepID=UPI00230804BC|nr:uncharacterized protein LOC128393077 [Panonychus citri]